MEEPEQEPHRESSSEELADDADGAQTEDHVLQELFPRRASSSTVVQRLTDAFGSEEGARQMLQKMGMTMRRVHIQETRYINAVRYNLAQYIMMLEANPSSENGRFLQAYIEELENNLHLRREWPTLPLEDPRKGTVLEGADALIFEHESEGLIRLQWNNPFPKPQWMSGGGFQCDVCIDPNLRMGYQHVTEDNSRDNSTFIANRIGFDVCTTCAVDHIESNRQRLFSWVGDVTTENMEHLKRCSANNTVPPQLDFDLESTAQTDGSVEFSITVRGTAGWHAAICAVPVDKYDQLSAQTDSVPDEIADLVRQHETAKMQGLLPSTWLATGTWLPRTKSKAFPSTVPEGCQNVEFVSAAGVQVRFDWLGERGVLVCDCRPAQANATPITARALLFSYRDVKEEDGEMHAYKPGDKAATMSIPGTSIVFWLPAGDCSKLLGDLRCLASRAGVAHNIPSQRQSELSSCSTGAETGSSGSRERKESVDSGPDVSSFHGKETALGLLVSPGWAQLEVCGICLDGSGEATWLKGAPLRTSCGHVFHSGCVRKHMRGHTSRKEQLCPNCRAREPLADAKYLRGDGLLRSSLTVDSRGNPFKYGQTYRVLAVLCQDPKVVVDSAMVFACKCAVMAKDLL